MGPGRARPAVTAALLGKTAFRNQVLALPSRDTRFLERLQSVSSAEGPVEAKPCACWEWPRRHLCIWAQPSVRAPPSEGCPGPQSPNPSGKGPPCWEWPRRRLCIWARLSVRAQPSEARQAPEPQPVRKRASTGHPAVQASSRYHLSSCTSLPEPSVSFPTRP